MHFKTHGKLKPERVDYLAQDFCRGFIQYCRIKAEIIRDGYFQSRVEIAEQHRQQDGFIHAGVMATMADHTAGYSAFTTVPEEYQILTVEFKLNFLRPAFGEALVCKSNVIRRGTQIIIGESEVYDIRNEDEVLVAKALVTLAVVHKDKIKSKGG